MEPKTSFLLEVVSDTICPWCYVGKRRLETALAAIGDDISFELRWRPFELNPDMPREGVNRKSYRSAKFGSWEASLELDAQVKAAGASDGLDFHHERMEKTPNTLASHVLIDLAGETGVQSAVVEALFRAYFVDGEDVGDPTVLAAIGAKAGLDQTAVERTLADEARHAAVKAEARAFSRSGVSGVPTVLLNRFSLFTGAQRPEVIERALRKAAAHEDVIASGRSLARA
ncbi:DsbA family oxidoreductase [Algihabitans albus]|uniref:DsbA family oxidoreductase n=1 Tax=Algihabitans albus TaxID=2164067 RepID=UPI0035CFB822